MSYSNSPFFMGFHFHKADSFHQSDEQFKLREDIEALADRLFDYMVENGLTSKFPPIQVKLGKIMAKVIGTRYEAKFNAEWNKRFSRLDEPAAADY